MLPLHVSHTAIDLLMAVANFYPYQEARNSLFFDQLTEEDLAKLKVGDELLYVSGWQVASFVAKVIVTEPPNILGHVMVKVVKTILTDGPTKVGWLIGTHYWELAKF